MIVRRTRTIRPGLSLLEVLLSLAIFLMSLASIAQLVDIGTERASDTILQNTGTRLAQSLMAEVEAGVIDPASGGSGTFSLESEWSWQVTSEPTAVPNLYTITATAFREIQGNRFQVSLTQMVMDPTTIGTAAEAQNPTMQE